MMATIHSFPPCLFLSGLKGQCASPPSAYCLFAEAGCLSAEEGSTEEIKVKHVSYT